MAKAWTVCSKCKRLVRPNAKQCGWCGKLVPKKEAAK